MTEIVPSKQSKGGLARAANMPPSERSEIARNAALKRWEAKSNHVHMALDEGVVDFVGTKFRCAVLEGEVRVISGTELMRGLGIYRSGALSTRRSDDDDIRFPLYLAHKNLRKYVLEDEKLVEALKYPLKYRQEGQAITDGLPGHVLRRILDVWVRALGDGVLGPSQAEVARRAKKLLEGLADVAIDALIDEATGYQKKRAHGALQALLTAYVRPEFRPYKTKFPVSFYEQIYRVMGWPFDASSSARTAYVGKLTNTLIYDTMPPGVADEIRRRNPIDPVTKRRKKKNFQLLTDDPGDVHIDRQIASVTTLLRASPSGQWKFFEMLFKNAFPPQQGELFKEDEIARLTTEINS
ncbi:hypothetical protein ACOSOMT5_P0784 [Acidiphilium sp. MT5]